MTSLCWYCSGSIDGTTSIGLPVQYNQHTGKYTLRGQFCSWPCVKSFNRDARYPSQSHYYALIRMLYASVGNKSDTPIPSLPPRERLLAFGGDLSREEFHRTVESQAQDILYVPEYLVDIRVHAKAPEHASSTGSQGFKFGPMKIPEKPGSAPRFPIGDSGKKSRSRKDVLSMLASSGAS